MRSVLFATFAIAAIVAAAPASAEVLHFRASLDSAAETPPNSSTGSGSAKLSFDTSAKTVSWTVKLFGVSWNSRTKKKTVDLPGGYRAHYREITGVSDNVANEALVDLEHVYAPML